LAIFLAAGFFSAGFFSALGGAMVCVSLERGLPVARVVSVRKMFRGPNWSNRR
jgi:hypothetical protein